MQTHQMKFGYEMCEYFKNALNIFVGPVVHVQKANEKTVGQFDLADAIPIRIYTVRIDQT